MKVAICLSGLVGGISGRNGEGGTISPDICLSQWLPIINHYNADVFLHSWSTDQQEKLKKFLPKKIKVETQKEFNPSFDQYNHDMSTVEALSKDPRYAPLIKAHGSNLWNHMKGIMWRSHSKYYSSKEVVKLKKEYEKENNFQYDIVILSRFDIWFDKSIISKINLENIDSKYFYVSPRTDHEKKRIDYDIAYHDLIVYGNSNLIDKFSLLYDDVFEYSVSAIHAIREHAEKVIGKENIILSPLRFPTHYSLLRYKYGKNYLKN